MKRQRSYGEILTSTSVMGGAAGVSLLLGMIRTKFAAVLIGTTGVGLLANFTAIQGLIGTIAGLGITASAIRDIAGVAGKNDNEGLARVSFVLRRICWITGIAGMLFMIALSPVLSKVNFGSSDYALQVAELGIVVLLANVSGGQLALLQGTRRIGDMARANVFAALASTVCALGFYAAFGVRGITPSLIAVAAITTLLSRMYVGRLKIAPVRLRIGELLKEAKGMTRLGVVMMTTGLMSTAVTYVITTLITQHGGVKEVGVYSAGFALSGVFVNFVLSAMGTDYYPRLAALSDDSEAMNRIANEQTEIGVLLAVPGLLATIVLAPWVIRLFYSHEFLPAAELLRWFILGCLWRVVSWPLGYILLARRRGSLFFLTEASFSTVYLALIAFGLPAFGTEGVAIAFCLAYVFYSLLIRAVAQRVTGFRWTTDAARLIVGSALLLVLVRVAPVFLPMWPATVLGAAVTAAVGLVYIRALLHRIGPQHKLAHLMFKLPGMRAFCGI